MKPVLTPTVIGVGVVSGLFWALGQANQLKSIDLKDDANFNRTSISRDDFIWRYRIS